jgi:hypothetical protein
MSRCQPYVRQAAADSFLKSTSLQAEYLYKSLLMKKLS